MNCTGCCDTRPYDSSEEDRRWWIGFAVGFGSAIATTSMGFVLILWYLVRAYRTQRSERMKLSGSLSKVSSEVELLTLGSRLEWADVRLCGDGPIAKGSYGRVWRGYLHNRHEVAVKIVENDEDDEVEQDKENRTGSVGRTVFDDAEMRFLQRTRHRNLVMFFGGGIKDDGEGFVVLEFMNMGDLSSKLWITSRSETGGTSKTNDPTWSERLGWLADAATGMSFLHDTHHAIHRDLKSANILLASDNDGSIVAKIADFGMAKVIGKKSVDDGAKRNREAPVSALSSARRRLSSLSSNTPDGLKLRQRGRWTVAQMTTEQGTPQWMAPELIEAVYSDADKATYTQAVDVYSFGIILWESMSLRPPWKEFKRYFDVWENVKNGHRPSVDADQAADAPTGFVVLMSDCWHQDPARRPSFDVVHKTLRVMSIPREGWESLPPVGKSSSVLAQV